MKTLIFTTIKSIDTGYIFAHSLCNSGYQGFLSTCERDADDELNFECLGKNKEENHIQQIESHSFVLQDTDDSQHSKHRPEPRKFAQAN